ncbi:MAG: phosphopantetheine-binding protein [Thermoguttaceae bacterium]
MTDQLKQAIADELNVDPGELTSDKRLEDLEYWDSVMVLSMMVIIGESVGKEITPEEMIELRTFGDIEALVASKQS